MKSTYINIVKYFGRNFILMPIVVTFFLWQGLLPLAEMMGIPTFEKNQSSLILSIITQIVLQLGFCGGDFVLKHYEFKQKPYTTSTVTLKETLDKNQYIDYYNPDTYDKPWKIWLTRMFD